MGATNVLRTVGKGPAIIALFLDILKGVITVTLLASIIFRFTKILDYQSLRILMGLAAISGHIWTIFLKFKGGKGVATSAGVLMILCPRVLWLAVGVWLIILLLTKYVSLGSILASISLPITASITGLSIQLVMFTITLCLINTYKHKGNIVRLINGEEGKIGQKAD